MSSPQTTSTPQTTPAPAIPESTLTAITQALSGLRYGQVTIIVQDGRVLQIDRTDRRRLSPLDTTGTSGP